MIHPPKVDLGISKVTLSGDILGRLIISAMLVSAYYWLFLYLYLKCAIIYEIRMLPNAVALK